LLQVCDLEKTSPDSYLSEQAKRLIGIRQDIRLLIETEGLDKWSKKHYGRRVALLDSLKDRYPLIIFHGDVGNGKTATAEGAANMLCSELRKEGRLFKLSTRVRGEGKVGEMSMLINNAFEIISKEAGKTRLSFLIIDEADSLAAKRGGDQSHHEDKVAVNTLIQKIDDARKMGGRLVVFLCTNRFASLDPAILRRAAYLEEFPRPGDAERRELFELDCEELGLEPNAIAELVQLTGPSGPHKLGYTFSDIRTRLLPDALAQAYPNRKIDRADLVAAVTRVPPSPPMVASASAK
jgi:SpoVK/Ycf46/Vps4 family AAA+-type ATPase